MAVDAVLRGLGCEPCPMKTYDHEHPRAAPKLNRDYDPVIRQWTHPPARWLWSYRAEPTHSTWDTVAGILGLALLGLMMWGIFSWVF